MRITVLLMLKDNEIGVHLKKALQKVNCFKDNIETKLQERTANNIISYLHMCLMKLENQHRIDNTLLHNLKRDASVLSYGKSLELIQKKQKQY